MNDWKDNVYFVLVEPKEPGNIGAAARAMKNMGFKNLCLVNPSTPLNDEAWEFAWKAKNVLESAETFSCLSDAISDKQMVAGTSRRTGRKRGLFISVEDGARRLFDSACRNRVAVLFGRESRGLLNEEVEECGFLMTIPASKEQPSLNLAQSVLITAYELSKAASCTDKPDTLNAPFPRLADHSEVEALYDRIEKTLETLEYIPSGDNDLEKKIMLNLRHLFGRSGLTDWELKMFHGICSQIEKKTREQV